MRLDRSVDRELVVVVARMHERDPSVPARWDVARQGGALVGVDVLAEQARPVAGVVQPRGEGRSVSERGERAERRGLPVDPGRVRVVARQDAGPARTAQRVRHERVGERDAAIHQFSSHDRHRAEGVPPLVIGHDQHHVRSSWVLGRRRRRRRTRGGKDRDRERRERQRQRDRGTGRSLHCGKHRVSPERNGRDQTGRRGPGRIGRQRQDELVQQQHAAFRRHERAELVVEQAALDERRRDLPRRSSSTGSLRGCACAGRPLRGRRRRDRGAPRRPTGSSPRSTRSMYSSGGRVFHHRWSRGTSARRRRAPGTARRSQ